MLQKEISDVRLVETQAPRNENVGSDGFGAVAQAAKVFGDDARKDKATAGLVAKGNLVNDFLAQRVEAAIETEGFRDLSDDAKRDITEGLGEFDRHLDQVDRSKGNQYTKAEILRTKRAMEEISKNPANHEAIVEAAGLSDKIGGPLRDALKEEEELREGVLKDMAEAHLKDARDNGVYVPNEIASNPRLMLEFAETDIDMFGVRSTKILQAKAKQIGAIRAATEIERGAAMRGEIPAIGNALRQFGLDAGQGRKDVGTSLLALDAQTEALILQAETDYPYATPEERAEQRSKIEAMRDNVAGYIKGEHKASHLDLFMRQLNLMTKQEQLKSARRGNLVGEAFDFKTADIKYRIDQNKLISDGMSISSAITKQLDGSDPFTSNMLAANPQLRTQYEQGAMYAMHGNVQAFNELALESDSPYVQADLSFSALMANVENPERIDDMSPERLVNMVEHMEKGLTQTMIQQPERFRGFMDKFLGTINDSPRLQEVMLKNPQLMQPLASMAAGEVRQSLQGALGEIGKSSFTGLDGGGVFNKQGSANIFKTFSNTVLGSIDAAISKGAASFTDQTMGVAELEKHDKLKHMKKSFEILANNPDQRSFYNNIGSFMEIDEDAVRKGVMQFKLSADVGELIQDPNFKRGMAKEVQKLNQRHSAQLSDQLNALNHIEGYTNPFHGYEEVMYSGGNLDLTNFIPTNTAIGADLQ